MSLSVSWFKRSASDYQIPYRDFIGNTTRQTKTMNLVGNVLLCAIFIIGCMGAAGSFPPPALGWCSLGLGGAYLGVKILGGNLQYRKFDLITSAIVAAFLITFGALGGAGLLTVQQTAYVLISVVLTICTISCCLRIVTKHLATPPLNLEDHLGPESLEESHAQ